MNTTTKEPDHAETTTITNEHDTDRPENEDNDNNIIHNSQSTSFGFISGLFSTKKIEEEQNRDILQENENVTLSPVRSFKDSIFVSKKTMSPSRAIFPFLSAAQLLPSRSHDSADAKEKKEEEEKNYTDMDSRGTTCTLGSQA